MVRTRVAGFLQRLTKRRRMVLFIFADANIARRERFAMAVTPNFKARIQGGFFWRELPIVRIPNLASGWLVVKYVA